MEQIFDSEESSSSGCESGWTLYLQHSISHDDHFSSKKPSDKQENDQEDDDNDNGDMSMVSDASSGPSHLHEHQEHHEDEYCNHANAYNENKNNDNGVLGYSTLALGCRKRRKIVKQTSFDSHSHRHLQDLPVSLDDTASSPFFSFSNKDLKVCNKEASIEDDDSFDCSQGHSTTYFEVV